MKNIVVIDKNKLNHIWYTLLLIPFFEPGIVNNYSVLSDFHLFYVVGKVISFGIIFLIFLPIRKLRERQVVYVWGIMVLFWLDLLFSTVRNEGSVLLAINYLIPIVGSCFFVIYCYQKNDLIIFFDCICFILSLLVWLNFLTVLLYPEGIYVYQNETFFLLGHNNNAVRTLLPCVFFNMIRDEYLRGKLSIHTKVIVCISLITVFATWSNTGMIACICAFIYCFFCIGHMPKWLTAFNSLMLSIIIFFLIVIYNYQYLFKDIIVDIFGKDLTLTNRTLFWNDGLKWIKREWLWGYGYVNNYRDYMFYHNGYVPSSLHNYYLDLLFRGGIVHLALMLIILIIVCVSLDRKPRTIKKEILIVGLLIYSVIWNFDPFIWDGSVALFVFLLCAWLVGKNEVKR